MHVITGGAGFLGSVLLRELNERGISDIVIVDNLGSGDKWRNLVKGNYVDYLHRDQFLAMARERRLPFTLDSLTHLGACSATTATDCDFLMENNFHYSQEMCRLALDNGGRFVNASSAATYGGGELGFSAELERLHQLRPLNMYGYSKHLFDLWLQREKLLDSVISLKFFNVYGPNEYHKGDMRSVACKLYEEIIATGRATLFASNVSGLADGEQKRDFIYVKDCARLMAWLLTDGRHINGIRNVGTGRAETFNEVARAVFASMVKEAAIDYKPMPQSLARNYQNYTRADMTWLSSSGFDGKFSSVSEGVGHYVRNYLAKADRYV